MIKRPRLMIKHPQLINVCLYLRKYLHGHNYLDKTLGHPRTKTGRPIILKSK